VVGGGTVTYGASSWRHLPTSSTKPAVRHHGGTGIADWPVSYDEIEPYYTQAEWEIGISGPNVKTPLIAPMSKPYPCVPLPMKSSGRADDEGRGQAESDGNAQCRRHYHQPP
jgi:choline dehydrogenase-like flavoprotein